MENIYEPDETFPFEQLQFISPTAIAGGNYFIRCLTGKQKPLYIQPPKCHSKSGVVKTGKRMYIDLVFKHDDEQFIEWIEKLENLCQTKIFDNREKWFESGLEMHDIENSFTPAMKIYKSGKMYIIRANIPVRLGKCGLKIYDEQENDVDPETIDDKIPLMTILEIQGIKCSSRNFQLELEVKQMMTLSPTDLFESCVFSKPKKAAVPVLTTPVTNTTSSESELSKSEPNVIVETVEDEEDYTILPDVDDKTKIELSDTKGGEEVVESAVKPIVVDDLVISDSMEETLEDISPENIKLETKEIDAEPVEQNKQIKINTSESSKDGLCEIDFPLDESSGEVMQLKNRNDVYFEMYQNAKRKAKIARDIALSAYLEAKQIKNTYLIHEDVEDDDDDEKNETELRNIEKTIEVSEVP